MKKPGILLSVCFFVGGFSSQILPNPKNLLAPPADAGEDAPGAEPRAVSPSPEPDESGLAGEEDEQELEGLARGGGKGKKVLVLEVSGVIDLGLAPYIKRYVENPGDAALIILDIDTPGGRVDAALQIRDALLASKVRTAAFIHPRAISAGALISYACDIIAISTGGSIGAATPINLGAGQAEAVEEKMMSYFRTEMAATARAKGRRGDLAEAMVDKDIEIEGITQAGKLLTLDTDNALRLKVADFEADSLEDLLEETGLDGAEQERPGPGWAELVARWLTHPVVSGLLMTIGFLGILIELYTPGFGAPGIVGLSCLVLFFFGHLIVHLAGWEELVILLVGITLLGVELFVTPGFGVLGAAGLLLIVASFIMALTALPITISFETGLLRLAVIRTIISALGAIGLFIVMLRFLPKLKFAHPLVERAAISARTFTDNMETRGPAVAPGETGTALSPLRPSGRGRIGTKSFDVIADGEFIDVGEAFDVVRLEGGKIIVRGKKP
jgi:membrane-bound serine protease (ClpP class)